MLKEKPGTRTMGYLAATLLVFLFLGHFIHHTFSALLTALVLAYLINPLLIYIEKRGFDRITSLILLYGIGVFAFFLASFVLIPYLGNQLDAFMGSFPKYVQNVQNAIVVWKDHLAPYYAGEEGAWLLAQADESLVRVAREFSGKSYEHLKSLLFGIFDLILSPILIFFILYYKQHLKDFIKRLLPARERSRFIILGRKINSTLERFIMAMILDCLLVGILTAIALVVLDIEFPVLNGLFAGFASIIPFLGVMVAVIPAALIGYAKSGDLTIIPIICCVYFVITVVLEGNLIKPLLMERTLKLNPLAVIFAVMVMGELLGFWGIVLAVPLAALIKICINELQAMAAEGEEDGTAKR